MKKSNVSQEDKDAAWSLININKDLQDYSRAQKKKEKVPSFGGTRHDSSVSPGKTVGG